MGAPGTENVRNVALVGHGGAGKTSLAEAMLFLSGAAKRLGTVEDGHSNLDYDPEEIKRKFSINLSLAPVLHNGVKINLIDTPGYADFIGDAIAGMEAAEMALFVVDAVAGPQVQTERLWKLAGDMGVARAIFINRMDKEHADFDAVMAAIEAKFGHRVGAVQIPLGAESSFRGVVDIIRMKAYHHEGDKEQVLDIPAEYANAADAAREKLTDLVAEADEALMEKYLEGEQLTQAELEALLDRAIAQGIFIPVFVGSAAKLQGIEDLMDEIVSFFPKPTAHGPVPTVDGGEIHITTEGAPAAFVFKTIFDPYVGRLNFVKVLSGALKPNTEFINSRTGKKERVVHVLKMVGKDSVDIEFAPAGDIAVVPKLGDVLTGDTLSEKGDLSIAPMPLPLSLYPVAIVAKTKADEDKLGTALNKLVEEEPTLLLRRDEETHQTVLSGIGDTAIDVAIDKLKERYNVEAELTDLRIPYRETIRKVASAQGRHKKQTGGSGQFGDAWLRLEPNRGKGYEFVDEIVGGRIPRQFIPAVDKGVQSTMIEGVLAGYPMVDVKVAVFDGSYHAVDSNEMAFRTAARVGFRLAAEKADMVLLEPVAVLTIDVPDEYAGAVMGDMSARRGRILGMDSVDGQQRIKAQIPYAEVVHYSPVLRSLSHGAGSYSIQIGEYAEVPYEMAKKVIEAHEKVRAEGH
ncbi:MAG: elongation factor G [Coriobacteriia bacterium]|nr:elongation factor G [Coriobacteriia bacterium]